MARQKHGKSTISMNAYRSDWDQPTSLSVPALPSLILSAPYLPAYTFDIPALALLDQRVLDVDAIE